MTNKTKTITGTAAAAALVISTIFIGNRYNVNKNVIQTDLADNYSSVIIFKTDTPDNVVYVYQADEDDDEDGTFKEQEEFSLKNDIEPGEYTMLLGGGDDTPMVKTFYVEEDKPIIVE